MDIKATGQSVLRFVQKYKYVCAIIFIGLVLMLLPVKNEANEKHIATSSEDGEAISVEDKLSDLLSLVRGAGEVHVLLTTLSGEEIVYKTDDRGSGESINTNTVIITDSNRNQSGLIQQKNSPVYRGAIVVCEGADNPEVRLSITDAVRNATGLRSDQISVLKMK